MSRCFKKLSILSGMWAQMHTTPQQNQRIMVERFNFVRALIYRAWSENGRGLVKTLNSFEDSGCRLSRGSHKNGHASQNECETSTDVHVSAMPPPTGCSPMGGVQGDTGDSKTVHQQGPYKTK